MQEVWQFAGVEVWKQGWQVIDGEEAQVHDPVYGKTSVFRAFCIQEMIKRSHLQRATFHQVFGVLYERVNVYKGQSSHSGGYMNFFLVSFICS
jgi:hypothetical protein